MAEQINVLYIDCHDLGDWLGCYGREYVHSPNLDRLAAQGARVDQYFSTAPICMPSRVSMYSGRYPHEAGCLGQMPYDEDTPMSFRAQLRPSSIYHFTTISARTWILWIQLLSAPFGLCEKTKANRYISFVFSPAPRRGAYEGVYSVDPASKVRNIRVAQSRPGSYADCSDRRCASHDDFTRIKTKSKPQRILSSGRSSTQSKTTDRS